jgi:hypothetical protein
MSLPSSIRGSALLLIAILGLIAFNRRRISNHSDAPELDPKPVPSITSSDEQSSPLSGLSSLEGTISKFSIQPIPLEPWTEETLNEQIKETNNGPLEAIISILNDYEVCRTNSVLRLRLAALTYSDLRSAFEVATKVREKVWLEEVDLQVSAKKAWQELTPLNENRNLSRHLGELRTARKFRDTALRRIQRMGIDLNDGEIYGLFSVKAEQTINLDRFPKVPGLD